MGTTPANGDKEIGDVVAKALKIENRRWGNCDLRWEWKITITNAPSPCIELGYFSRDRSPVVIALRLLYQQNDTLTLLNHHHPSDYEPTLPSLSPSPAKANDCLFAVLKVEGASKADVRARMNLVTRFNPQISMPFHK